jgi:hypothetical protein
MCVNILGEENNLSTLDMSVSFGGIIRIPFYVEYVPP